MSDSLQRVHIVYTIKRVLKFKVRLADTVSVTMQNVNVANGYNSPI